MENNHNRQTIFLWTTLKIDHEWIQSPILGGPAPHAGGCLKIWFC